MKRFYTRAQQGMNRPLPKLNELRPFTIQGFCLRAVNRILQDGRTKITLDDIEAIKESVLAEVNSIRRRADSERFTQTTRTQLD